jgi:hypothetical protein
VRAGGDGREQSARVHLHAVANAGVVIRRRRAQHQGLCDAAGPETRPRICTTGAIGHCARYRLAPPRTREHPA